MASVKDDIDLVSRFSGLGNLTEAMANAIYGINHRGVGNPIPYNTDNQGLTFFTRPRLNLSYDNISMDRRLTPLLTRDVYTYQRAIRVLLDPVGAYNDLASVGYNSTNGSRYRSSEGPIVTPLVDRRNPFIVLLTNNILSLNGWPDPVVAYFNAKPGPKRETWGMIDDVADFFDSFDLQANFRNIAGDPITLLFEAWRRYAALVYEGVLMPYPDAVVENEIDYMTRIYRLVLDPSRQFVTKIAACGAAFPTSSALGAAFNYTSDAPFNQETAQQISIPFHCYGAIYNDPILFKEFNDLVGYFNNDMLDNVRAQRLVKLQVAELNMFNTRGCYPRIHPLTHELEWWVPNDDYKALTSQNLAWTGPTEPGGYLSPISGP